MPIHAILFDLDGTLVDSEREAGEALARLALREFGLTLSQIDRDYVIGHSWGGIHAFLKSRYDAITWTAEEMTAKAARERDRIVDEQGLKVMPGVVAAVRRFDHLRRAIVTGSSRAEADSVVVALDLVDAFQTIVGSDDVTRSKPDPEGYLMAARALDVAPEHCVVIEDSHAGIAAGRAAGAQVIAVRAGNFIGADQSAAHHIIDTLDQLTRELVDSL